MLLAIGDSQAMPFVVAVAIGLVLGFEREHHEWNEHQGSIPTGARTLAIVALAGAVAAYIDVVVVGAGVVAVAALLALGYWRSPPEQVGQTTEFASLMCFLLGALCQDDARLAAGIAAGMAVLLESKGRMRRLLREIVTPVEVEDAVRWFALAFVVYPLIPDGPFGPEDAFSPSQTWRLLLILTGIGWIGHIATRAVGDRRGMLVAGVAGGFVSGAATTASLARIAKGDPGVASAALGGMLLASVATCIRLVVMTWITDPSLGGVLFWPMLAGSITLMAIALLVVRRAPASHPTSADEPVEHRPLAMKESLIAATLLTLTLAVATIFARRSGTTAVVATSAVVGFADAHSPALTAASLTADSVISQAVAVKAVGFGLATNTVTKIVLAVSGGGLRFGARFTRLLAPGIVVVAVALWATIRAAASAR
jgi:uncharacterized membrane protein (DUF4010 family)